MALTRASAAVVKTEELIGFRNKIINGDMRIDQRNAGASVTITADGQFGTDRFKISQSQNSKFTIQRSTTAPSEFTNSLLITVTSAVTPSGSDFFGVFQPIEGFNVADLAWGTTNAKTITLSFWVRSSLTGTFSGMLFNNAANRSYCFTYSIGAANTFEYKTVTITGDTSGTWTTDNTNGLGVYWDLGSGTNTGTSGLWQSTIVRRTSSSVQLVATNGATFYLTGVQLEVGSVATPFERRPYGMELALCQRYFFQISSTNAGNGENTGMTGVSHGAGTAVHRTNLSLPVTMRVTPTMSVSNVSGGGTDFRGYNGGDVQNFTSLGTQFSNPNYVQADWTLAANLGSIGDYITVLWKGNINGGWIRLNSEL